MEIVFFSFFSEKKYNNMLGKTYFLDCLKYSDNVLFMVFGVDVMSVCGNCVTV